MRGGGPLIGKDGKIVPLPSTIKASLISGSSRDLLGAKSTPSSDTPNHGNNNHHDTEITTNYDINDNKQQQQQQPQNDDYPRAKSPAELEQVRRMMVMLNELTLKDVQEECHPDVYECWKDVDADLDRVERVSCCVFFGPFYFLAVTILHNKTQSRAMETDILWFFFFLFCL